MAATRDDISRWYDQAQNQGATHMIIGTDPMDHSDFPVYVMPGEDVYKREKNLKDSGNLVTEVYSMKISKALQMREYRAFHYD
jgi:hypothetical protein